LIVVDLLKLILLTPQNLPRHLKQLPFLTCVDFETELMMLPRVLASRSKKSWNADL